MKDSVEHHSARKRRRTRALMEESFDAMERQLEAVRYVLAYPDQPDKRVDLDSPLDQQKDKFADGNIPVVKMDLTDHIDEIKNELGNQRLMLGELIASEPERER